MGLDEKIRDKSATIAVIGLGYVGLPLAVEFARVGYKVIGLDTDASKVARLREGSSYIQDISSTDVAQMVGTGRLEATTEYDSLTRANAIFICVPTPFNAMKAPDLSFILSAAQGIASRLQPDSLVVLQSTTYPGTTDEDVQPILEKTGLKAGHDFHLAFSPERINPGDKVYSVHNTPKVVGGLTPRCTELAALLLAQLFPRVHIVSTPRAAEMTKLLENIFRSVNIALVNELALLCERMGINVWEVIEAASTKPFGYMPFYPGPGVGGHCIPVDPYYLSWKAREYDFYTKFIELAAEVNQAMPYRVVSRTVDGLNRLQRSVKGARVLVLGIAFKPDVDDARNTPAERIIELLLDQQAQVSYHDPYVPKFRVGSDVFQRQVLVLESQPFTPETIAAADAVIIVSGHHSLDYQMLADRASLIIDTVNAMRHIQHPRARVELLGAPRKN
ncbi:MAG: nucleotide sugar dehydrogenase [Chloroflexi bacterium]|nr:nucleotide sugar dehydrogenase [Chloroflexota bacterium]